jgi:hypothetical protein
MSLFDAFDIGVGLDLVNAFAEEGRPVIKDHLVEVTDELARLFWSLLSLPIVTSTSSQTRSPSEQ